MKKGLVIALMLSFILVFFISFSSANIFTEIWNKITGQATTVTPICGNGMLETGELCDYAAAPNDSINNPYGSQCSTNCWVNGFPPYWNGCRGSGAHVCSDNPEVADQYYVNHPKCIKATTCAGLFYPCNGIVCPEPTAADGNPTLLNQSNVNNQANNTTTVPLPPPVNTTMIHWCGNGAIDQASEQCDTINLDGKTCASFGYNTGVLRCTSNCTFDTSQCTSNPINQTGNTSAITGCREITSPGNYALQSSISGGTNSHCINIHDTSNVNIDCQGKTITIDGSASSSHAMDIRNVNGFSLKNCIIRSVNTPANSTTTGVYISGSNNGQITGNNLSDFAIMTVQGSSGLHVYQNNFYRSIYQQSGQSNNNIIEQNYFESDTAGATLMPILLSGGSGNTVQGNFVEGHGVGVPAGAHSGADDGIVLDDESGSYVIGNTVQNFWDCGIETEGLVQNTVFSNNTIRNSAYCGIGGWYWASLKGNTFLGNSIDNSGTLFTFYRRYALSSGEQFVYFTDNRFTGNILTNPNNIRGYATDIEMGKSYYGELDSSKFMASNNLFMNNNFGTGFGPYLDPVSSIVDGGGNICGPVSLGQAKSPLNCNAVSSNYTVSNTTNSTINTSSSSIQAGGNDSSNETGTGIGNCQGCFDSGKCYPIGYRQNSEYCTINLSFTPQLADGSACQNSFECGSGLCVSNQCVSQTLLQQLIAWFKNLFGIQ